MANELQKYFETVYQTSIIRFDDDNVLQKLMGRSHTDSDDDYPMEDQDLLDAVPAAPVAAEAQPQQHAQPQLDEIDGDSPPPREKVFFVQRIKHSRSSKAQLSLEKKDTREDLSHVFMRLRGEEIPPPPPPEKHDKPRTGCEGFCIPGYCKGPTCKKPPDNVPRLKGVLNCMSISFKQSDFDHLRHRKSEFGASVDDVIQHGVDQWKWNYAINQSYTPGTFYPINPGVVAFDASCYRVFRRLIDPVIQIRHTGYPEDALHPHDCNPNHVPDEARIFKGRLVLWCGVLGSRNFEGHPFVPLISRSERRSLDGQIKGALDELEGGSHYDLDELPHPNLPELREVKPFHPNPLREPHFTRDFPHDRHVWAMEEGRVSVMRQLRDHASFVVTKQGSDLRGAFIKWLRFIKMMEIHLSTHDLRFVVDDHLGYLTSLPSNLGTAMTLAAQLRLPALARFPLFDMILSRLRLRRRTSDSKQEPDALLPPPTLRRAATEEEEEEAAAAADDEEMGGTRPYDFTIVNSDRLGITEVESYIQFVDSINKLIEVEEIIAAAEVVNPSCFPETVVLSYDGLERRMAEEEEEEEEEEKEAKEEGGGMEDDPFASSDFPKLKDNNTIMAKVLDENRDLYEILKTKKSKFGFSFMSAIQLGLDHPKGPLEIRNELARVGFIVGDEDCYKAFGLFYSKFIPALHTNYRDDGRQLTSFDLTGCETDDQLDMHYIAEIRIETSRNIRGIPFPAAMTRQQRRLVERIVIHSIAYLEHKKIEFEVKGHYSQYAHLENLKQHVDDSGVRCFYFPVEDRLVYKKAGLLRDWPDARGYWANSERTVLCNVNELDHMMISTVEKSPKMRKIFTNHRLVLEVLEERLQEFGRYEFAYDPHFGFLVSCPGSLGTATYIIVQLRLRQLFKNHAFFLRVLRKHRLGFQRVSDSVVAVFNLFTLGFSEYDTLEMVYEGCKKIIEIDKFLEAFKSDAWIENEKTLPLKKIAHLIHCDWSWFGPHVFDDDEEDEANVVTEQNAEMEEGVRHSLL